MLTSLQPLSRRAHGTAQLPPAAPAHRAAVIRPARRPLVAWAATAAGGGGSGAGGTRRPRSIALAAAARMLRGGVEVAPAELLTQYSAQQQASWRRGLLAPCSGQALA